MTSTTITTDITNNTGDGFDLAASGDALIVDPTISVSGGSCGVRSLAGGIVTDYGAIDGGSGGIFLDAGGDAANVSEVTVGSRGTIESALDGSSGVDIAAGPFTIYNFGDIIASPNDGDAVETAGPGTVVNANGSVGMSGVVSDRDATSTDHYYLRNYGSIGNSFQGFDGGSASDIESILNSGGIYGAITLSNGKGDVFNSTLGGSYGTISAGSGGDTIIAGNRGGMVVGGIGNDILYANPTQAAANNAAQTTLDGGVGKNALYGDGAYTTFLSGDTDGGYNQIWGEQSQMTGVSGYANDTLSYADAATGIYVDLATNDAYVNSTGAQAWKGTGTFEDSIEHVPNVIGSAYGDLIAGDNGVDRITGGGGADKLSASTGGSSQDTFVYTGYSDSNLITGYDTIAGFKIGVDKIDLSAMDVSAANLVISTKGLSNTVYVEQTQGVLNANNSLAISVNTAATGGLHASDFVF